MQVERLAIPDVVRITPKKFGDERGFFSEVYNAATLASVAGIRESFVQDNHSLSRAKGVVRGLHFQTPPFAQGKLVRVTRGAILDVAVDLRHGSATFGQHVVAEISAENWAQLWIPSGFAHGFCTLEADTEVIYKVTAAFSPEHDKGVRWNDPAFGIDWPVDETNVTLSDKDQQQPMFADLPEYFVIGA